MPLFTTPPQSVCFLRLSALGDVCHALAAIQAFQLEYPTTKITWIVGKVEALLLDGIENIELIVFDKKSGFASYKDVWQQLKHRKFDALIHMQLAFRASLLTTRIHAKYKVGFHRSRAKEGQWLFTNKKITDTQSLHVLDSFYSFVEYLGVPKKTPKWNIPIPQSALDWVEQTLSTKQPVFAISPAASKDERNWLTQYYAQLADYAAKAGFCVVLCGSPTQREKDLAQKIQQEANSNSNILNLVGKTNLKQLLALLKRADIVLSPDSGPAHMATTQGTPVIGLYAHSNPKRTGPYNSLDYVVSTYEENIKKQYGKSSDQLAWATRVKGSDLMAEIKPEKVIEKFNQIAAQIEQIQ